ncbi:MAG: hypothetical protein V3U28_03445 [Candidatus Acidoferrales bacterium]
MKRTAWMVVAGVWVAVLASCGGGGGVGGGFFDGGKEVSAQGPFSNATLQGTYGYSFQGFESDGDFVVAVGHVVFDGLGNITDGSQRRNEQGFEFQFALTGTYNVNGNGTGRITTLFDTSVDTWKIILVDGGRKVKIVSIEPNNFLLGALVGEMEAQ